MELQLHSLFNLGAKWGREVNPTTRSTPRIYGIPTLHSRRGEPQGLSGRVSKIFPPLTGVDSRTAQPVAQLRYPRPRIISGELCKMFT